MLCIRDRRIQCDFFLITQIRRFLKGLSFLADMHHRRRCLLRFFCRSLKCLQSLLQTLVDENALIRHLEQFVKTRKLTLSRLHLHIHGGAVRLRFCFGNRFHQGIQILLVHMHPRPYLKSIKDAPDRALRSIVRPLSTS